MFVLAVIGCLLEFFTVGREFFYIHLEFYLHMIVPLVYTICFLMTDILTILLRIFRVFGHFLGCVL